MLIPAMSHAAEKPFNARWRLDSKEASRTKSSAKSKRVNLHLLMVTHIGSAELVHPVHVKFERRGDICWRRTHKLQADSKVSDLMAINRCPTVPYSFSTFQNLFLGTRSYASSRLTEHAQSFFAYSKNFSDLLQSKISILSAATWTKTTLAFWPP